MVTSAKPQTASAKSTARAPGPTSSSQSMIATGQAVAEDRVVRPEVAVADGLGAVAQRCPGDGIVKAEHQACRPL